jgi:superfamily II DNA or RNA helicase
MITILRDYQRSAANACMAKFQEGVSRIVIAAPTGSGKSVIGAECVRRARAANAKVLAIAHRRELISQLCGHFGSEAAAICPGFDRRPDAPIQVATIQTLLASGIRPEADLILWDECHHAPSDEWQTVLHDYDDKRLIGLTATPCRSDGKSLGDIFQHLHVAVQYSQLLREGHIAPCRVFQAPRGMASDELAMDPVAAIKKHAKGKMFVFCRDVEHAYKISRELLGENIMSSVIEHQTPTDVRAAEIQRFNDGDLQALCNVFTLTEGIDIPSAETCVLARGTPQSPGTYLQMVGRVLRVSPGKKEAILIDLTGASLVHGLPTEDREYSLCGKPIGRVSTESIRVCLKCGYTYASVGACPACGFHIKPKEKKVTIYSHELREVYAGRDTPGEAKLRELDRLLGLAREKSWSLTWVLKQFRAIFFENAPAWYIDISLREEWFGELRETARTHHYKQSYPHARYYAAFGCWPEWR